MVLRGRLKCEMGRLGLQVNTPTTPQIHSKHARRLEQTLTLPTTKIWIRASGGENGTPGQAEGAHAGLGTPIGSIHILLYTHYLSKSPSILFCPKDTINRASGKLIYLCPAQPEMLCYESILI